MDFTMRGCSGPDLLRGALLALLTALGACSGSGADGRFEVEGLSLLRADHRLEVTWEQRLSLSPQARDALRHGVPLTIESEVVLRDAASRTRLASATQRHEISFLPLSEHYRVSGPGPGGVATYPRLRHVLGRLSRGTLVMETGPLATGEYEVRVRSRLDTGEMPPPMRLPALFDPAWRHASAWSSRTLTVAPEA